MGQLSSLVVGLTSIDRPGIAAVMVTLVDVPLIDSGTVESLIGVYKQTRAPIVRPVRKSEHGHPVIFDRKLFGEFRRADPEGGAKTVIRAHSAETVDVQVEVDGPFMDVDTPDDYLRVFSSPLPVSGGNKGTD